jgi:hypothetical protein
MTWLSSLDSLVRWLCKATNNKNKSKPPVVDRQLVTFFCFAKKKVTQEKATPVCRPCGVPCVARLVRRLRNSHDPLRVHVLKQCWLRHNLKVSLRRNKPLYGVLSP